jgi:hypothetical protein
MWHSSWNFTPDPRSKILIKKTAAAAFAEYPVSVWIITELKIILILLYEPAPRMSN